MKARNRIEMTIETHRILTIGGGGSTIAWCEGCGKKVRVATCEMAALALGFEVRAISQLIEARKLHFTEHPTVRSWSALTRSKRCRKTGAATSS